MLRKFKTKIKNFLFPAPAPVVRGILFECDNIRKIKGEELNNVKIICRNYTKDGVLTRLITSKANQIKDKAIKDAIKIISETHTEASLKLAEMCLLESLFKIKGLEEAVEEIKFFAKNDEQETDPNFNPNATI